jgi:hypothetical protein
LAVRCDKQAQAGEYRGRHGDDAVKSLSMPTLIAVGLGGIMTLVACAGKSAIDTPVAVTTASPRATTPASLTTTSPTPRTGGVLSSDNVEKACAAIRSVQADLDEGQSGAKAYRAQLTLILLTALDSADLDTVAAGQADKVIKAACPQPYADFLRQSGIASLSAL